MKKMMMAMMLILMAFCISTAANKHKKVPQPELGEGWHCTSGCEVTGVVWNVEATETKNSEPVAVTIHCNREGSCCTFTNKGVMIWDMDPSCPKPKIQIVPKLTPPSDSTMQVETPYFNPPNPNDLEIRL
jgi:hypothetical protein